MCSCVRVVVGLCVFASCVYVCRWVVRGVLVRVVVARRHQKESRSFVKIRLHILSSPGFAREIYSQPWSP